MKYAIAVIDIGMTNKKVAVYDDSLQQVDAVYKNYNPVLIKDPITGDTLETHDLEGMKDWFFEQIKIFANKYPIKAIATTTHGATFVCLDKNGKVCAPCVFYTYEPGEDFQKEFYSLVGSPEEIQRKTFSPKFSSMINPAKGIFFLQKHFPKEFAETDTILNFAQYWSYLLTGKKGMEPTFISNHSCLWNHAKGTFSDVVDKMKIRNLFPSELQATSEKLGTITDEIAALTGLAKDTVVAMGVHDSNASLLPYLTKDSGHDFILNSTGTWCVSMHPQEKAEFNEDDIGKIVYFTQSALNKPVKIAIFLGGMELDNYVSLYKEINKTDKFPEYAPEMFRQVLKECDTFLLPELVPGSGQYTTSKAGIMEKGEFYSFEEIKNRTRIPKIMYDEKKFWAVLDISMVIQTVTALTRSGMKDGTRIFTEGGFRKNKGYNTLLASVLPSNQVSLTNIAEATAFGAAMTAAMAYTGKSHTDLADTINIEYVPVEIDDFPNYENYRNEWEKLATKK